MKLLGIQALGVAGVFVWTFGAAMIMFLAIKAIIGIRVTKEEELRGLDIDEHGIESYPSFQIFTTQ